MPPARPRTFRRGLGSTSRTRSLATATSSNLVTQSYVQSKRRVTRRHTTRTWLPTGVAAMRSRGSYSPATRCSSATWAGRICTPRVMRSELARELFASVRRLLELPDGVLVYPSHYGGSVCGRSLSGNPFSTIGFERHHNTALAASDVDTFVRALLVDVPPPPADQAAIVAANRAGTIPTRT